MRIIRKMRSRREIGSNKGMSSALWAIPAAQPATTSTLKSAGQKIHFKFSGGLILMINFSVWVDMSDTEKLIVLISKNTEKVSLLDTKMEVVLFDNLSC